MRQKPTILIECENLTLAAGTGIATYARNLALTAGQAGFTAAGLCSVNAELSEQATDLEEIALFDARKVSDFQPKTLLDRVISHARADAKGVHPVEIRLPGIVVPPNGRPLFQEFSKVFGVQGLIDRGRRHFSRYNRPLPVHPVPGIDAFHTTHIVPLLMPNVPNICTIHDIIPLRLPYTTLDNKNYFYNLVRALVEKVDHIVTVSEHSRQDIIRFFGIPENRITNTYQSVEIDPEIANLSLDHIDHHTRATIGVGARDYYLFVGAIEPKKNLSRLIDGYAASGTKRPLIVAGGLGWQYEGDVQKMRDARFRYFRVEDGRVTGHRMVNHVRYLPRKHLLKLIKGARALVFPSVYEGFGLPVLEAMSLGTPVITSTTSSLPEVAGNAALLVDPYDVDSIARAIQNLDRDDALCSELAKLGTAQATLFSSSVYQERIRKLYNDLVKTQ